MLYILKMTTKIGVVPKSFCQNRNPVQDQDHDFTLDFNSRSIFNTSRVKKNASRGESRIRLYA